MRRRLLAVLITLGVAAAISNLATASDPESDFISMIASERSAIGVAALGFDSALINIARRHSADMAAAGKLYHNDNLPNEVTGWLTLGENVGRGGDVGEIHKAFMDSPTHRHQILDPDFRGVAVGVVASGNTLWVTEIFIQRASTAPRPSRIKQARPRTSAAKIRVPVASAPEPPVVAAAIFPSRQSQLGSFVDDEPAGQSDVLAMPMMGGLRTSSELPPTTVLIAGGLLVMAVIGHVARITAVAMSRR